MAMMRRRGGLVRAAATTAVVAGTATAVSGRVARRQERKYQEGQQETMMQDATIQSQQEIADLQSQVSSLQSQQVRNSAMMPPAAAQSMGGTDVMSQLQQLVDMTQAGMLSEEEFQSAKASVLAG